MYDFVLEYINIPILGWCDDTIATNIVLEITVQTFLSIKLSRDFVVCGFGPTIVSTLVHI